MHDLRLMLLIEVRLSIDRRCGKAASLDFSDRQAINRPKPLRCAVQKAKCPQFGIMYLGGFQLGGFAWTCQA